MDFEAYETFLENLSSIMRGIDCLIQKAESKSGKRFVWSPVAPDVVAEGTLDHVGWGSGYANTKLILPAILKRLDDDNYIVELVCIKSSGESVYLLSVGY